MSLSAVSLSSELDEQLAEPGFPLWIQLTDNLKSEIILKLSYRDRRALKICSSKEKQLVGLFPFRKKMMIKCKYCAFLREWYCAYTGDWNIASENPRHRKYFDTPGEAYENMKEVMKTAEFITELNLDLKINSKIKLRDDQKQANIHQISLWFIGGDRHGSNGSYEHLFEQINADHLKSVILVLDELRTDSTVMVGSFFEIEKTVLKLQNLSFYGVMNDEQLLGLRSSNLTLWNSKAITFDGVVKLIRKVLLQTPASFNYRLHFISCNLEMSLFEESLDEKVVLLFNTIGSDQKLKVSFEIETSENDSYSVPTSNRMIHLRLRRLKNKCGYDPFHVNNDAVSDYPVLQSFLSLVAEVLPSGFNLLKNPLI